MDEYQTLMILTVIFMALTSFFSYRLGVDFGYEKAFYHYIEGGEKTLFTEMGVNLNSVYGDKEDKQ